MLQAPQRGTQGAPHPEYTRRVQGAAPTGTLRKIFCSSVAVHSSGSGRMRGRGRTCNGTMQTARPAARTCNFQTNRGPSLSAREQTLTVVSRKYSHSLLFVYEKRTEDIFSFCNVDNVAASWPASSRNNCQTGLRNGI